jgi:hypothetical protein
VLAAKKVFIRVQEKNKIEFEGELEAFLEVFY